MRTAGFDVFSRPDRWKARLSWILEECLDSPSWAESPNARNRCVASFDVCRTGESATKRHPVPIIHLSPMSGDAKPSGPAPSCRRTVQAGYHVPPTESVREYLEDSSRLAFFSWFLTAAASCAGNPPADEDKTSISVQPSQSHRSGAPIVNLPFTMQTAELPRSGSCMR